MQLPRALAEWADLLSLFPQPTALSLGAMVRRLAPFIGPLRLQAQWGTEEPDGFQGLARKGAVEHLLPSEWLLADELPHEFDRRAAMNEQLFFRRRTLEPRGSRLSLALFDAGPDQLGAPRIAHLALLILLSRRAQAGGADFAWGVLQNPQRQRWDAVTPETIKHLLQARTAAAVTPEDAAAWQAHADSDDFWIIGSARTRRLLPTPACVQLQEDLEPGARTLTLTIHKDHAPSQLQLKLPDEALCVRLLRDPFKGSHSPLGRTTLVADARLCFSRNARRLAVTLADGGMVVYPLPGSVNATPGKPRYFRSTRDQQAVAVDFYKKRLMVVTSDGEHLLLHRFPSRRGQEHPLQSIKLPPDFQIAADALLPCFYVHHSTLAKRIFLLDGKHTLYKLRWPPGDKGLQTVATYVTGLSLFGQDLIYASRDPDKDAMHIVIDAAFEQAHTLNIALEQGSGQMLPASLAWDLHTLGTLAVHTHPQRWTLIQSDKLQQEEGRESLEIPTGLQVIGVLATTKSIPTLITVAPDRKQIALLNQQGQTPLISADSPIRSIVTGHDHVAWLSESDRLMAYDLSHRSVVLDVVSETSA